MRLSVAVISEGKLLKRIAVDGPALDPMRVDRAHLILWQAHAKVLHWTSLQQQNWLAVAHKAN